MKALYFSGIHEYELRDVEKPQLRNDTDVIIKITLTTICGSDLHLIHGIIPSTPGYVLGHEYVGVVEEAGKAVKNFKEGDRVIGPPAPFCGCCENCIEGNISHCLNGGIHGSGKELGDLSGTHAEYIRVPFADSCLVHVPDVLEDEQVIFISDILTTGYTAAVRGKVSPGDTAVIFGAGPVGLCSVVAAKLFNPYRIIAVGRKDKFRMEMAKKLGATHVLSSEEEDAAGYVMNLTNGRGADAAIDASGSEIAIRQAVKSVKINGNVSLVGITGTDVSLPLSQVFMRNVNISMGLAYVGYMKRLISLVMSGQIDLRPLITHRMDLEQIEEAVKLFENRSENVIKIIIKP
ncbi:S-(hydroxymethyl)glutathione dehydrogenase/alcohol dehydrogenase/alcohol dehydrogenase [Ruminiclostridium sufflavum DSM 19573]|uniref:S-(Hydroxymethyl)glutathione dehydrogenase/alcohol dehydrogenase/alcohol dehydrogenase n=1 Tax=Ruminiclostridium sufflavum DSM 19573 TaxID=1121337 RepID=A0A318XII8_9FIRM|nr:alcohol dehydrogenase catalytic domain-containing protein [Ruminiclostridium sufflavum]PYG85633.1 S-(hydroxymethyl)glutathione dehydrogenase/alcohol dehydrogenase/alcohol dehydrogenase [Ruminiclostridium sufflavum DSM 19573]